MAARWQKPLVIWCCAVVVFGAVLMGAAFAQTDAPTVALFHLFGGAAPEMTPALRFSAGLMGAVTSGWGLTLLGVASASRSIDPTTARALWRRIIVAVFIWYVLDCTISVTTGFALNALSNTALVVAFIIILWRGGLVTRFEKG